MPKANGVIHFKMLLEVFGSGLPIEGNSCYAGMIFQQRFNFVWYFIFYVSIQTAGAGAGLQHIPKCQFVFQYQLLAGFIVGAEFCLMDLEHDFPKQILRMGVVLLHLQGAEAGHGTED